MNRGFAEGKVKVTTIFFIVLVTVVLGIGFLKNKKTQVTEAESVQELNLYAMSDYLPDEVLRDFETRFNAKIRYDNFSNNEELLAKLQAGATGYDVIIPSDYMVTALIANKLLQPLDQQKLPNLHNLGEDFRSVPYDKENEYSVPYMWGTTGLVYNSKFVKDPQESWDLLFKAEYKGRISLLEDAREAIGITMRKLGFSGNSTDKKELDKAQALLAKLKPSVRIFTADPKQHLQSEDVWIAQVYSGDAMMTAQTKPELKYFVPKEGSTLWIDNMAIPTGARNANLAHVFINYILEPEVAEKLAKKLLFSTPNAGAEPLIEDTHLRASHIKNVKSSKVEFLKDLGPGMELWDEVWTKVKSN